MVDVVEKGKYPTCLIFEGGKFTLQEYGEKKADHFMKKAVFKEVRSMTRFCSLLRK